MAALLDAPIAGLPGAGPVTAARLAARGLARVRDLLCFFPRAYDDYRRVYRASELADLPAGTPVVVRGRVVRVHKFFRRMLTVEIEEEGVRLRARWFRPNPGLAKTYARGSDVAVAGKLHRDQDGQPELIHPSNVTALLAASGRRRHPAALFPSSRRCPDGPSRRSSARRSTWPRVAFPTFFPRRCAGGSGCLARSRH